MEGGKEKEEEQDGVSVHSPCKAPPSSASSVPKEQQQVELELRLLEALEIYPPVKLRGVHRHFVLYGLMEFLRRSLDRHFSPDEVLQLLDRFYNLEVLKPDDEEVDILNHEEDFCLPQLFCQGRILNSILSGIHICPTLCSLPDLMLLSVMIFLDHITEYCKN